MEITYLEDDDEAPRAQRPRLPQAPTPTHAHRPPVPRGAVGGSAWFICVNEGCGYYGHVATGKNEPTHVEHRVKCRTCKGLGIVVDEGGDQCEDCGGSGRRVRSEEDVVLPVKCPHCRQPMDLLQEGGYPAGYPRMNTFHTDEDPELRGLGAMGRTRIVSDG